MKASAGVAVSKRGPSSVFDTVRSDPPLLLRQTPDALMLVGGAAGPLTGDDLSLEVTVGPGATLKIGSVAASIAQAGPGDPDGRKQSVMQIHVTVGAEASLDWDPKPLISTQGSNHRQHVLVELHETATLRWRDTVICGRAGQPPGAIDSTLRVERAGRALLHQQLLCADIESWLDPSILGGARALINDLHVGGQAQALQRTSEVKRVDPLVGRVEALAIAEDATLIVAVADDLRIAESLASQTHQAV